MGDVEDAGDLLLRDGEISQSVGQKMLSEETCRIHENGTLDDVSWK